MRRRSWAFVFLTAAWFLTPRHVYADAMAFSSISFSNVQIGPSAGSVAFGGPWLAEGFAQAQNSLGDLDPQYNSSGGIAAANASVTFGSANGSANAGNLTGLGSSNVNLAGLTSPTQGISVGRGTLSNTFTITGGTGSTNVNFSAAIAGLLQVVTDSLGVTATTETIFNLQVDGNPLLFFDSTLTGGQNFNSKTPFSQTLNGSLTLNFNTPYSLWIQADSESMAISNAVPEPSTLTMMLVGLGLIAGFVRNQRHY